MCNILRPRSALLLMAQLFALASPASAADTMHRTVVLEVSGGEGGALDENRAALITDVLVAVFATAQNRTVLGPADYRRLIALDARRQAAGCTQRAKCLVDLARALEADRLVLGTVAPLGPHRVLVVITEIDARTLEPVGRAQDAIAADAETLLATVRRLGREVITTRQRSDPTKRGLAPQGGTIVVDTVPPGALVAVSGQVYGPAPQRVSGLVDGEHRIRLTRIGYADVELAATAYADRVTNVRVEFGQRVPPAPEVIADYWTDVRFDQVLGNTLFALSALFGIPTTGAAALMASVLAGPFVGGPALKSEDWIALGTVGSVAGVLMATALILGAFGLYDALVVEDPPSTVFTNTRVSILPPADKASPTAFELSGNTARPLSRTPASAEEAKP